MKTNYFAITLLAVAMLAGCRQKAVETPVTDEPVALPEEVDAVQPTEETMELVPVLRKEPSAQPKATTPKQTQPAATSKNTKAETIYVETEGAQGRVWGHVTMQGDRGTGTIHDWDENTWAVTVTRHGNELYAVDQNSRQYVFKLKK